MDIDTSLCADCGHDGYEEHDMRSVPPACGLCDCGSRNEIAVYPCECGHAPHDGPCGRLLGELLDDQSRHIAIHDWGWDPKERCACPSYTMDTVNGAVVIWDDKARWTVTAMVARAKAEIVEAIRTGWTNSAGEPMPATVESFSRLHDYCDANELGGVCDDAAPLFSTPDDANHDVEVAAEAHFARTAAMQDEVDRWLKDGGLLAVLNATVTYTRTVTIPGMEPRVEIIDGPLA